LFLGVDGIDDTVGLTTFDPLEARLNAAMVRAARRMIVVADSSKFGRRGLAPVARPRVGRRMSPACLRLRPLNHFLN